MDGAREITVSLPADLVERAAETHGKSVVETITDALEDQARRRAWSSLGQLRGKVQFGATWQELAGKYDDE